MVHSALKRKRYSSESSHSALSLTTSPSVSIASNASITTAYQGAGLHCTPTNQASPARGIHRTPSPPTPTPIKMLLELMTPSEFAKLLRARVKRVLAKWPPPSVLSSSHGLPSPTSSSSSASCRPTDTLDPQELGPGTIQAFISFFRSEDMPTPHCLTLQELHTHVIALQTLLSFLTSRELRDIINTRLNACGSERDRLAAVQGVLDVMRNTGKDDDDRDADSEGDATAEACNARYAPVGDNDVLVGVSKGGTVTADVATHVEVETNTVSDRLVSPPKEQSIVGDIPASLIPSSSQRPQEPVKVERPRKRARTIVISRRYPRTMKKMSPFLVVRSISTSSSSLNPGMSHSVLKDVSQHHSAAESTMGSKKTSVDSSVFHLRKQEEFQASSKVAKRCPGSDGGKGEDLEERPVVCNAGSSRHDSIREEHPVESLLKSEDTCSRGAVPTCQPEAPSAEAPSVKTRAPSPIASPSVDHMDQAISVAPVEPRSPTISGHTPSAPFIRRHHAKGRKGEPGIQPKEITGISSTPSSDQLLKPLFDQSPCRGGDVEMDVDMDMSDDGDIAHGKLVEGNSNILGGDSAQTKVGDTAINVKLMSHVCETPVGSVNATPLHSHASPIPPKVLDASKTNNTELPVSACYTFGNKTDPPNQPASQTPFTRKGHYRHRVTTSAGPCAAILPPPPSPPSTTSQTVPAGASSLQQPLLMKPQPPTFVPARLPQSPVVRQNILLNDEPTSPSIKKELISYEGSLSSPKCSTDVNVDSGTPSERSKALARQGVAVNSTASSDPIKSEKWKIANNVVQDSLPPPLSSPLGKVNVETPRAPAVSHGKPGARSPPIAPKRLSNVNRLPSFPVGRQKLPNISQNMTVPSAPRAMSSLMSMTRSVFVAPTGEPTAVAIIPPKPTSALRPEGPELPPSSNLSSVPPSAPKNSSTFSLRTESMPFMKQQRSWKGKLKQGHPQRSPSPVRRRRRSLSSSISSRSSSSRSRSRSPSNGPRGGKCRHRLPRRRSISPSLSTYRPNAHRSQSRSSSRRRSRSSTNATRYRSKRSASRSRSRSPNPQTSALRTRNDTYPRPSSPLFLHDPPVTPASNHRHWSPEPDRLLRGRRNIRRDAPLALRGIQSHDHWSPGGNINHAHSSRQRWGSNDPARDTKNIMLIDADILAQPMNPRSAGGRKSGAFRRS